MSPFRWDVLGVGFVLALPLLVLYLRGDLTVEEATGRLPWCLVGAYVAVLLVRWAATPRSTPPAATADPGQGHATGTSGSTPAS